MNTPTPEDIEVATLIEHVAWCPAHLDIKAAAQLIADHCAPLRELAEIGRLRIEQENSRMDPNRWLEVNQKIREAIGEYQTKRPTS